MNTPSILEVAAAKTIFDDLHAIHHAQAYDIHNVVRELVHDILTIVGGANTIRYRVPSCLGTECMCTPTRLCSGESATIKGPSRTSCPPDLYPWPAVTLTIIIHRYWNETIDAGNFIESPVLDPDTGFGGDGVAPNGCIADGPMVNYTSRFGPGYTVNDHCIYRSINNRVSTAASQANIDRCMVMMIS